VTILASGTLHYRSHSLTVQLRTVLLKHSSSYAADCCRRTKQLLLHVLLTHWPRDTLSESSYKQKEIEGVSVTILASWLFITVRTHWLSSFVLCCSDTVLATQQTAAAEQSSCCYMCCSTHCWRDTLSESSYKQKKWKEIIFLACLALREVRTKHEYI
jgi:hypothetical protein